MANGKEVLIVMGSHREDGFSAAYAKGLERALLVEGIQVETLSVNTLRIDHCLDCPYCEKHFAQCVIKDDMGQVYEAMKKAKQMVVISPVYFNNVTSKLKKIIDRTQMIFMCQFAHKEAYVPVSDRGFFMVSFGGAKAYENQFLGSLWTLEWVYRNLSMVLKRHLCYAQTDVLKRGVLTEEMHSDIMRLKEEIKEAVA